MGLFSSVRQASNACCVHIRVVAGYRARMLAAFGGAADRKPETPARACPARACIFNHCQFIRRAVPRRPVRRTGCFWQPSIVRNQSRSGSHKTLAAERPAVIPT